MAFCTSCGTQIPAGTKFCPACGQKIETAESAAATVRPAPICDAPTEPTQNEQLKQEAAVQGSYQSSYTPPTEQSNTPPAQQSAQQHSYQAQEQQSYTPPTEQSYEPQSGYQQNYSAQPAYAPANNMPKQKKPMNKKTLAIIGGMALVAIIAVVLIVVLGGKSDKAAVDDPNLGIYNAKTASMLGIDMNVADLFENGFSIELIANGKCVINADGTRGNGSWTLKGDTFHVNGGGLDCDGTLKAGVLTLEDVLGMGVTLGFEKEGGYTGAVSGASVGDAGSLTPLQQQWNGTWFGCLYVSDATGDFAKIPSDSYDVYMTVNVDAQGKGTLNVYLNGADAAFACASCQAKESGLYATSGTIAGGASINANNWMFLPMPDYPDQYTMGDSIDDGDSLFNFTLFMKKWGNSWQAEIDSNFAITPPSVEWYETAIANGEQPPVGGSNASGGVTVPEQSSAPADSNPTSTGPTTTFDYGSDGMVVFTYPTDMFAYNDYWENLETSDGSVSISFMADWSESDVKADLDRFDSIAGSDDYSLE